MKTGIWSLPTSWLRTVRVAFLDISSVPNVRSGVVEVSHRLEKKVGGLSGSFRSRSLLSICQSETSSPLRSASGYSQASEWPLKSPSIRHWLSGSSMWPGERSLSTWQYALDTLICCFSKVMVIPWISAWLLVLTQKSWAGTEFLTRIAIPPLVLFSLSCLNSWYLLVLERCDPSSCVSCRHATSIFTSWSLSTSAIFLLYTSSAFHCRMFTFLVCVVVGFGLAAFALSPHLLALQGRVRWPPVTESGSFWGLGPGTLPPRWIPKDEHHLVES